MRISGLGSVSVDPDNGRASDVLYITAWITMVNRAQLSQGSRTGRCPTASSLLLIWNKAKAYIYHVNDVHALIRATGRYYSLTCLERPLSQKTMRLSLVCKGALPIELSPHIYNQVLLNTACNRTLPSVTAHEMPVTASEMKLTVVLYILKVAGHCQPQISFPLLFIQGLIMIEKISSNRI